MRLSNFIIPIKSVSNAPMQRVYRILLNPISPAFWITYTMSSTNFIEPNTSVLNAHIQWVYLNLLNQARSQGERVSKRLQFLTETKTRCNVFAAVSDVPICCIPPNGDINFISRPSQNSTLITLTCYKTLYNLPMSAASAVVLIQCSSNFRNGGPINLFSRK